MFRVRTALFVSMLMAFTTGLLLCPVSIPADEMET